LLGLADTPDGSREGTVPLTAAARPPRPSGASTVDAFATLSAGGEGTAIDPGWPVIPGYELIDELGVGGGGTVYLAKQLAADGRLVALKVIHGTSRQERERMTREMRALGRLTHPNVVTLFDADEAACGPYFTMEYLQGGSLARRIDERRPTPAETARIVEQVARAAQAAHDMDILHRDLKPSNVLLGSDGTAKVADFGLAKLLAGDETPERLTLTNHLLGTPSYMAPEQAGHRHSAVGPQTDVYGLGGILYHCLTGRPPFKGVGRDETLLMVLRDELVLPRSIDRSIPAGLEAICVKCLEKSVTKRYHSAEDMAADLARWQRKERTAVPPVSAWRRCRRQVLQMGRLTTIILAVGLIGWLALNALRSRKETLHDETDAERSERLLGELDAELATSARVLLVGPEGEFRWARWDAEGTPVRPTEFGQHGYAFQSVTIARFELLPPRLVPIEFVLEGELRHDADDQPTSEVGLYWGAQILSVSGGPPVTTRFTVTYNDFDVPASRLQPKLKGNKSIQTRLTLTRPIPGKLDVSDGVTLAGLPIRPGPLGQPRDWRRIKITVTADGTECALHEDDRWVSFTPRRLAKHDLNMHLREKYRALVPGTAIEDLNALNWSATGSLGLWVQHGQGAFRNVTVTPIRRE
jgi:serine/threonine-protein kinase